MARCFLTWSFLLLFLVVGSSAADDVNTWTAEDIAAFLGRAGNVTVPTSTVLQHSLTGTDLLLGRLDHFVLEPDFNLSSQLVRTKILSAVQDLPQTEGMQCIDFWLWKRGNVHTLTQFVLALHAPHVFSAFMVAWNVCGAGEHMGSSHLPWLFFFFPHYPLVKVATSLAHHRRAGWWFGVVVVEIFLLLDVAWCMYLLRRVRRDGIMHILPHRFAFYQMVAFLASTLLSCVEWLAWWFTPPIVQAIAFYLYFFGLCGFIVSAFRPLDALNFNHPFVLIAAEADAVAPLAHSAALVAFDFQLLIARDAAATSRPLFPDALTEGLAFVPHEFRCPITQQVMREPTLLGGHTFERDAILEYLSQQRGQHVNDYPTHPMTRRPLKSLEQELEPNFSLRSLMEEWLEKQKVSLGGEGEPAAAVVVGASPETTSSSVASTTCRSRSRASTPRPPVKLSPNVAG